MFWYDDFRAQGRRRRTTRRYWRCWDGFLKKKKKKKKKKKRGGGGGGKVREDDAQLFDRLPGWPLHQKRASVGGRREKVILDGRDDTGDGQGDLHLPRRCLGLTLDLSFFDHWLRRARPVGRQSAGPSSLCPGPTPSPLPTPLGYHADARRLGRNVVRRPRVAAGGQEKSPEWQALGEDGATLFTYPMGIGVARERIQKDLVLAVPTTGASTALSEDEVGGSVLREGRLQNASPPTRTRRAR